MKHILSLFVMLICAMSFLHAQNQQENLDFAVEKLAEKNEFYFVFERPDGEVMKEMGSFLSIDDVTADSVFAYANKNAFETFLGYNIPFHPKHDYYFEERALTMATTVAQMSDWDRYPTHDVYVEMMQAYEDDYPNICNLDTIGYSENGYPLLVVRISDNVSTDEDEPEFFWTNTMHGDELVCYPLSLRLIDYLLSNYGSNPQVNNLIDEVEIYVNPLANPDATFYGSGGTSVANSTRENINGVDLNRNFPQIDGDPVTNTTEIQAMIDFANERDLVMAANTHGGAELLNYPWDHWTSAQNAHADDAWFDYTGWIYADLAQSNSPSGYFTDQGGVTEGADWYSIDGSRQDYMTYFQNCREVTIELSSTKKLDAEDLPAYWGYNYEAMLAYTEEVLYGIRGIVTDACSGDALAGVKVEISGHDKDNSEVYSSALIGNYHRPIYEGTWDLTYSKDGYQSQTHTVSINNGETERLDIELVPNNAASPDFTANTTTVIEGGTVQFTDQSSGTIDSHSWSFPGGTPNSSNNENPSVTYNTAGTYNVSLEVSSGACTISETKENYISVSEPVAPVVDFSATPTESCTGLIQFSDASQYAESWSWDFGDGTTSDETNPSHQYTENGTYTVSLTATNSEGSNTETKTDYITINMPGTPTVTDAENCGPSEMTLEASTGGTGELRWYENESGGTHFHTGTSLTENFSNTTTYFVANHAAPETYAAGKTDNSGDGGYYDNSSEHGLIFNALSDFTLKSVKVYADGAGDRTIRLLHNEVEIASATINIPDGESRIDLNFEVSEGDNYKLMGPATPNLYRNGGYWAPDLPYPYETPGVVNITWNTADNAAYYYYFYDWEVEVQSECTSQRIPVTATVLETPAPDLGTDTTICSNEPLTLDAGSGYTSYLWSTGSDQQSIQEDEASTYSVVVTGNNGCTGSDNITVSVNEAPSIELSSSPETGNNEDGTATVSISGGTPDYTITWSSPPGGNEESLTGLSAGTYCVTVMDDFGCTAGGCVDVESAIAPPDADFEADITEGCGSLEVQFTDISTNSPTSWSWDFGDGNSSTEASPVHVYDSPGTYTVSLTATNDGGSDTETKTDFITVYENMSITFTTVNDISCNGLSDGSLEVSVDGGSGVYSYNWEDASGSAIAGDEQITDLMAGTYYLTVTDDAGCSAAANQELTQPEALDIDFNVTDCSAPGVEDGSIEVIATGGTPDYMYNNGSGETTNNIFEDLSAGQYTITVTDDNGCTATGETTVSTFGEPPIVDFSAAPTEGCGSLSVEFSDESAGSPDVWAWDFGDGNSSTDQNPQHTYNNPGIYTVSLTASNDFGDDTHTETDLIQVYPEISIASVDIQDVYCHGDSEGSHIEITVTGGDENYDYYWEDDIGNSIAGNHLIENIPAGMYFVTVTDGIGCSTNGNYQVNQPESLSVSFDITPASGPESSDGIITAIPAGGTEPYDSYEWSDGSSGSETLENIEPETYCVTVTDALGCTAIECAEVPYEIEADFEADETEICKNEEIQFTDLSNGGDSWLWDFGDGGSSDVQNPAYTYSEAGIYTLSLTVSGDGMEDTEVKIDYIIVNERPELSFETTIESAAGAEDGTATVLIDGGESPYFIVWSNGETTETITGLSTGNYSVAVQDANQCSATGAVFVDVYTLTENETTDQVTVYPNPAKSVLYLETPSGYSQYQVFSLDGRLVRTEAVKNSRTKIDITGLNGVYLLRILHENGEHSMHRVIIKR